MVVESNFFLSPDSPQKTEQKQLATELANEPAWTVEDSKRLYAIEGWGEPYFSINEAGNITVDSQSAEQSVPLDLYELVRSLKQRNIQLPLLIRFTDILADRLKRLHTCMDKAIAHYHYPGKYQGVFPIKCNQDRHLLANLLHYGKSYGFGLEVGSKPELIVALAMLETNPNCNQPQPLLICNGFKDREYIETALLAGRLGQKSIIVIEQLEELSLALEISQQLEIKPVLGVRAKLNTQGTGRWGNSTGDRAKFGLSIPQIIKMLHRLEQEGMLGCLQLLHFHIGSQISAIAAIKNAIREASQIYVQLAKMGANMQYLDVGGGLAIDYSGSKTDVPASKNYNMQNYANDIVAQVKDACDQGKVHAPTLVSESGRAIASHQSVLIFDVLATSNNDCALPILKTEEEHLVLRNFWETYNSINQTNYQETYHDAIQFKEEALSLFNLGYLSLVERSRAEQLYWACCHKLAKLIQDQDDVPADITGLATKLASIYHVNLSIFKSAPDAWAINQLFPIMPIHRLDREPSVRGILADLTCDSDGKIDRFIGRRKVKELLELHPLQDGKPYYLAMFLVGAYQEIMGNLHNLFGSTNLTQIQITAQGYQIEHLVQGDAIKDVLDYVDYDAQDLLEIMRRRTETALRENLISLDEAQKLLSNYKRELSNYTYLTRQ